MMGFLLEPTFTAFLALILYFIVAKIVFFAVSNSNTDGVCSVNEGAVAKEVTLDRGLRVRGSKGQKRVTFVDDVVIRRIDRYEGSENLVGEEVILETESVGEQSGERADQENGQSEDSGERKYEGKCCDEREGRDSEKVEMLIEREGDGDNITEKGIELDGDDATTDEKEGNVGMGTGESEGLVRDGNEDDDDDDWEGIERSELEKVFAEAVNYVEYGGKRKDDDHLAKLSSDVQMELYGLHKVAVEGPCAEPSPMALKVSARAKWNAWQKHGSMNREAAMEQYIRVLYNSIPGWMHDYSADDDIQRKLETVGKISVAEDARQSGLSAIPVGDSSGGQSSIEKDDFV